MTDPLNDDFEGQLLLGIACAIRARIASDLPPIVPANLTWMDRIQARFQAQAEDQIKAYGLATMSVTVKIAIDRRPEQRGLPEDGGAYCLSVTLDHGGRSVDTQSVHRALLGSQVRSAREGIRRFMRGLSERRLSDDAPLGLPSCVLGGSGAQGPLWASLSDMLARYNAADIFTRRQMQPALRALYFVIESPAPRTPSLLQGGTAPAPVQYKEN